MAANTTRMCSRSCLMQFLLLLIQIANGKRDTKQP
jgi:hypothetical protein